MVNVRSVSCVLLWLWRCFDSHFLLVFYFFHIFINTCDVFPGSNYSTTLMEHLSIPAVHKIIGWLNSTNPAYQVNDGYFTAELYPGEHLHAPISVLPNRTQSVAWDFVVEDGGVIDFKVDIVLPAPGTTEEDGAGNKTTLFSASYASAVSSAPSSSSASSIAGTSSSSSSSSSSSGSSGSSANKGLSLSNPNSVIARSPTDPEAFLQQTDCFRPQFSHRLDAQTRKGVGRGNSFINWPCNVGGLAVIQFERPSQSWLSSLTCGLPGMRQTSDRNKPIRLKFKISSFEHNL
jgi:hypothetical protein